MFPEIWTNLDQVVLMTFFRLQTLAAVAYFSMEASEPSLFMGKG
jgi:hypothetical protein